MKPLIPAALVFLAGCGGPPSTGDQAGADGSTVITAVDTVVSTRSGLIGYAVDLAVDSAGGVYLADGQAGRLLRVDPETDSVSPIGGPGQGPGEFDDLAALRVVGEELLVVDAGNGRLQRLSLRGEHLGQAPVSPLARMGAAHIERDGSLMLSSMGTDTALARVFDAKGEFQRKVGEPVVIPPAALDVRETKATIADGGVPGWMRNLNLVVGDGFGGMWVILRAEGEVRRYDASGGLVWTVEVNEPELEAARQVFFERNAALESPMSVAQLSYFADAQAVGDDLWVLLDTATGTDAVVIVVSKSGSLERRITIRGAGGAHRFLVDTSQNQMWLATREDAQLLRTHVPN